MKNEGKKTPKRNKNKKETKEKILNLKRNGISNLTFSIMYYS